MHRSDASAFARVLNLLGCDLATSVVQANEAGSWESEAVRELNDRILASAGMRWDGWLEFPPGWLTSPRVEEFREEALALIGEEFSASPLFVMNDPRICHLVPFWLGVFEAAGVRPLILSPVSSPLGVAASREERDGLEAGLGHLAWLRSVLDAEFASRGTTRFFTSYDRLSRGWARIAADAESALGVAWPRRPEQAAAEIEGFLADDGRHERQPTDRVLNGPQLSDGLRSTFEILARWSAAGETPQDYPALDLARAALNTAAPAFSRLLDAERQRNSQLESRAETAEHALAEMRLRLAETESALAQRSHEAEHATGELAAVRDDVRQAAAARTEAEKTAAGLREHVELLMADVRERQARAARQAEADAAMAKRVKQVLAVLDTSRQELTIKLSQAEQARAAQAAELQQRTDELESLRCMAEEGKAEADQERLRQLAALEIGRAAGLINGHGAWLPWKRVRLRRQAAFLKRSGVFDAEWYLRHNPDVANAGIDPLRHYIEFGAREGRAPCPALTTTNGKA